MTIPSLTRLSSLLRRPVRWVRSKFTETRGQRTTVTPDPTAWIDAYFRGVENVHFIQIGAYDGVDLDLLRPLVLKHRGWCGALVEPMPEAFERLKVNYASEAGRLQFLNCAISSRTEKLTMYEVDSEEIAKLPWWAPQVASMSKAHVKKHFPDVEVREREVDALTFLEATRILNMDQVDLLAMDVEGHEREIIESIDFTAGRIRVILYERKHLEPQAEIYVTDLLCRAGFVVQNFGDDAIAYRPSGSLAPSDANASRNRGPAPPS